MRRHPWLTAAIVLVVLFGVVHFCLEWRAEQRWQRYAAEARARGVKLMLTDFTRPEIPDTQNFAMLPMMQKAFRGDAGRIAFELPIHTRDGLFISLGEEILTPIIAQPVRGEGPQWKEIAEAFRSPKQSPPPPDPVREVLLAMELYAPDLEQWSQWHQRKECRFAADSYLKYLCGHGALKLFSNAAHFFALRAHAHLAVSDSTAAAADFREGMQAYNELREEQLLAIGCYRLAILRVMTDVIGDGLRRRAWDDGQLREIQEQIETIRLWDDYRFTLASERAAMNTRTDMLANASMRERERIQQHFHWPLLLPTPGALIAEAIPRRFIRDAQLDQNRYFDTVLARLDPVTSEVDFNAVQPPSPLPNRGWGEFIQWRVCCIERTDLTAIERSFAAQQVLLNQARLVCALERYRLARGAYPATLTELVPQFIADLPHDPYARAPYHYQRAEGGTFLLYGVGVNRRDDGGQINPTTSERDQLDAIWLYAPPPAP